MLVIMWRAKINRMDVQRVRSMHLLSLGVCMYDNNLSRNDLI